MTTALRLHGKVAIVTGGARGIGLACCEQFAAAGAQVLLADIDDAAGHAAAASLAPFGTVHFAPCDVTDPDAMQGLVAQAMSRFGGLHVAVNNAGVAGDLAPLTNYGLAAWDRVIATNLTSVFYGMRAQIPAMDASGGGSIVNIASTMGTVAYPNISAYVAAKHGVVGLTKAAALEAAAQHIRVNAVAPSFIRTKLTTEALPDHAWGMLVPLHALNRLADTADVARLVCFLASDEAAYITGSVHVIDGGYTAR